MVKKSDGKIAIFKEFKLKKGLILKKFFIYS